MIKLSNKIHIWWENRRTRDTFDDAFVISVNLGIVATESDYVLK